MVAIGGMGLLVAWVLGVFRMIRGAYRLLRLLARFIDGQPIDGTPRTNATFLRAGDRVLTATGRASHWAHLPGWERAAIRLGVLGLAALAVTGYVTGSAWAWGTLAALGACGALIATWRAVARTLDYHHRRRYVRPLATALRPILGYPSHTRIDSWLHVPRRFTRDGAEVSVTLPPDFTGGGEAQKTITSVVRDKLGMSELDASFSHVGRPVATFRAVPRPPKRVTFDDARPLIESAPESAPLIGVGHRDAPVSVDLDSESPHILISASTGGGKSVTARAILAQILHNGGLALVLDIKLISHAWARGLPNVRYVRHIEDIHDALVALRPELDRRNALVDEGADQDGNTDHVDLGPRLVVLLEEINGTSQRLQSHWQEIRGSDDPKRSPAVDALADALYMGRAVRIHVLALGQMLTARALGGPELRECFGTRILARYTANAWRMLLPEVWPMPKSSRHPGRVQVGLAGQARETQVAFLQPSEAREWALSGEVSEWGVGGSVSQVSQPPQPGAAQGQQTGTVPGLHLVTDNDAEAPVSLSEAVDNGAVSVSLEVLRAARKRDPEFPAPIGRQGQTLTYSPAALERWERNRPGASRATGA